MIIEFESHFMRFRDMYNEAARDKFFQKTEDLLV